MAGWGWSVRRPVHLQAVYEAVSYLPAKGANRANMDRGVGGSRTYERLRGRSARGRR